MNSFVNKDNHKRSHTVLCPIKSLVIDKEVISIVDPLMPIITATP